MIMKHLISVLTLTFILTGCTAQPKKSNTVVAFYNVENLFDTKDDPNTLDDDFTPKGSYRYTEKVYLQKLHNIANVIRELDADVIGLAEIENNTVLKDLINQRELQSKNYKYAWFNSTDARGIDVALLYNPQKFKIATKKTYPIYTKQGSKRLYTREVLYVSGKLNGEQVHILVNHWPSRREGKTKSTPKRIGAATTNKLLVDSLLSQNRNTKIIIMGDMNDNPDDVSIAKILNATADKKYSKKGGLYNPFAGIYEKGRGTSVYHKHWDHFDQIIISDSWLIDKGLHYDHADIFDADFIRNEGHVDAYPKRSFRGKQWNNGYSDHLPIMIYLN